MAADHPSSTAEAERRRMPPAVTAGAIVMVFAVNLAILGYAVWTTQAAHGGAGEPAREAGAEPTAPSDGGGTPEAAAAPALPRVRNPILWPRQQRVRELFTRNCSECHGAEGRGDGPAATLLLPRPRNFVESPFHFVPPGGSATEVIEALRRTIQHGLPQSAMLGWRGVLSDAEIAGLAQYVYNLRSASDEAWPVVSAVVGARPPFTADLIAKGEKMFASLACTACHGDSGHGDGPSSKDQVDFLGNPARPADLASGLFKSGPAPEDLCRTLIAGIPGTPMASFQAIVTRENEDGSQNVLDAWALVAYVKSLSPRPPRPGIVSGAEIVAVEVADEAMLRDPAADAWLGIEPTELALRALQQRPGQITHVSLRAARAGETLGLCLEWREETMSVEDGGERAPDSAAVMFGLGDSVPAVPLGAAAEPAASETSVNVWRWSAERQWEAAGRSAPGGEGQGCIVLRAGTGSSGPRPVLEANGAGSGSPVDQAAEAQGVLGTAMWCNGLWRVVFARSLAPGGTGDVDFTSGRRLPIVCAVWDGGRGDRGEIKMLTSWSWLTVPRAGDVAGAGDRVGAVAAGLAPRSEPMSGSRPELSP